MISVDAPAERLRESVDEAQLRKQEDALQQRQHELNKAIGQAKREGTDPAAFIEENREVSRQLSQVREALKALEQKEQEDTASDTLSVEVLTSDEQFEGLRAEWADLIERANVYSPFMRWEWLYPWWKYFGENKQLRLICVRDGSGALVGLAPMMLGFTEDGRCDRRALAFVGSGEEGPRGQYFTFMVSPGNPDTVLEVITDAILEMRSEWDTLRLWRVLSTDAFGFMLEPFARRSDLSMLIDHAGLAVYGDLPATVDEFIASVPSAAKRKRLRHQERKVREKYPSLQEEVCQDPESVLEGLEHIHRLNIVRLQSKRIQSTWENEAVRSCMNEIALLLSDKHALDLRLLYIDNEPVAGRLGLVHAGTYFGYESGFLSNIQHLDLLLMKKTITACIARGLERFDWLSAHGYMWEYFTQARTLLDLNLFAKTGPPAARMGWRLLRRGIGQRVKAVIRRFKSRRAHMANVPSEV